MWIEFEPQDEQEDMIFAENVFGGSVPKNFFPAVEKGLRECCTKGVLAGYPMVFLKATLYDGSYHPVDSSETVSYTPLDVYKRQVCESLGPQQSACTVCTSALLSAPEDGARELAEIPIGAELVLLDSVGGFALVRCGESYGYLPAGCISEG